MRSSVRAFCLCGTAAATAVAVAAAVSGAGVATILGLALLGGSAVGALAAAGLGRSLELVTDDLQEARHEAAELRQRAADLEEKIGLTKEYFTNTVHELRTPLTTILAALDMLREGHALGSSERTLFLDQATAATRHITFLINDMLDTAAIEMGKLSMHIRKIRLSDVLGDIRQVMEPIAQSQDIELRVETPAEDLTVLADHNRMLQVSFNLISNAIKYSRACTMVTVRAFSTPQAAVVEVEDQGMGVPLQARKRLFTKFSRVHKTSDSDAGGSGIGLYLSKVLVEQMGGSIGYRGSDRGTGSVFWFTLPVSAPAPGSASAGELTAAETDPESDRAPLE